MNLKKLQTPIDIKDVDFRVQSINKGGYATILSYKNARVDMNVLDDVCGPQNWQRDHKEINDVVYCGIGINVSKPTDQYNDWVWKWDAGAESSASKEKGQASDSFKRAAFNWGIGRELYDYPTIQVKLNANEFKVIPASGNYKARVVATFDLQIKNWTWTSKFNDKNEIIQLAAWDQNAVLRFNWKAARITESKTVSEPKIEVKIAPVDSDRKQALSSDQFDKIMEPENHKYIAGYLKNFRMSVGQRTTLTKALERTNEQNKKS
jgi:hypothetical protein